jgi:hypothetical protein
MLNAIKVSARATLKRALGVFVGAVFAAIGLGFLTHSAGLYLYTQFEPEIVSLILGTAYLLVGIAVFFVAKRRKAIVVKRAGAPAKQNMALVEAFMVGMNAGQTRGSSRG